MKKYKQPEEKEKQSDHQFINVDQISSQSSSEELYSLYNMEEFSNDVFNNLLWRTPKSVKQVVLKNFGIRRRSYWDAYQFLKNECSFDISLNGQYIAFIKANKIIILNCFQEFQSSEIDFSPEPKRLQITNDSQYLIVNVNKNNEVYSLINNKKLYSFNEITHNGIKIYTDQAKTLYHYVFRDNSEHNLFLNIFDIQIGRMLNQFTFTQYPKFCQQPEYEMGISPYSNSTLNIFTKISCFRETNDRNYDNCLLRSRNGKVLFKTQFQHTYKIFGLHIQHAEYKDECFIFRLYNTQGGKLLKKFSFVLEFDAKFEYYYPFQPQIITMKSDLIIQLTTNTKAEQLTNSRQVVDPFTFCTIEIQCFKYNFKRCFYKGLYKCVINVFKTFAIRILLSTLFGYFFESSD